MNKILLLALVLSFSGLVAAHEGEFKITYYNPGEHVYPVLAAAGALIILVSIYAIYFQKKMREKQKKVVFAVLSILTIGATLYLIFTVGDIMLGSATGGPVHWHADFELWACGEKLAVEKAQGWSTRVGPVLLHHHGDDRIHIEGVVQVLSDIKLQNFFRAIGGNFNSTQLSVVLEDGSAVTYNNGDLCPSGKPGVLKLFVNGKPESRMGEYVISPYTDIPPGDVLKIVFEEETG